MFLQCCFEKGLKSNIAKTPHLKGEQQICNNEVPFQSKTDEIVVRIKIQFGELVVLILKLKKGFQFIKCHKYVENQTE